METEGVKKERGKTLFTTCTNLIYVQRMVSSISAAFFSLFLVFYRVFFFLLYYFSHKFTGTLVVS